MKTLVTLLLLTGIFFSCQQKQHFTSCAEIDLIKKLEESYFKGDFAAYRAFFHDTASIYINNWYHEKISPDQFVEILKKGAERIEESSLAKDGFYEMVVTTDGQHWIHVWTEWTQMLKNGKEVRIPLSNVFRVENAKIVFYGAVLDALPGYLAEQAIDKGTFMSIHTISVKLNPGVTMEQFADFYKTKVLAGYEEITPGLKTHMLKYLRGEGKGSMGVVWTFQSEKDRDQYYNDDGTPKEAGKALHQKMQPVLDELWKLGSITTTWTDWVVQ
jgi:hypothetical protein